MPETLRELVVRLADDPTPRNLGAGIMRIAVHYVAACVVAVFTCSQASALPVAPAPHLTLDELVKEYKRLGLPLPPPNAELVRVRVITLVVGKDFDQLGFRLPATKPGDQPVFLVGSNFESLVIKAEPIKPHPQLPDGVEPAYVVDLLCLAVQCRVRGWNEFAEYLYARARAAIETPVPDRLGLALGLGMQTRANGWELREENTSEVKELRSVALAYWDERITARDSDRAEVLRHLKDLAPDRADDIRALERTVAPRKSKPGSVASLIDDLTDYWPSGKPSGVPLDDAERGEAAYRKLVELGFDAVPELLNHLADERFTRYRNAGVRLGKTIVAWDLRVQVCHVVGELLNDISGRAFSGESRPQLVDAELARVWWEKARKEGEEKWLVAHALPGVRSGVGVGEAANSVIYRTLGVKYPTRLAEVYRTVLSKHPRYRSHVLADEVAASKLPRAEKLALLVEGADNKNLDHRNAALKALSRLDPVLFRTHLIATLKKLPPDVVRWRSDALLDLVRLVVGETADQACLDALVTLTKRSVANDRIAIIESLRFPSKDDWDKISRPTIHQFLLRFVSDNERGTRFVGYDKLPGERVGEFAADVLASHLGVQGYESIWWRPEGLERLLYRAAVVKLATEALAHDGGK